MLLCKKGVWYSFSLALRFFFASVPSIIHFLLSRKEILSVKISNRCRICVSVFNLYNSISNHVNAKLFILPEPHVIKPNSILNPIVYRNIINFLTDQIIFHLKYALFKKKLGTNKQKC